jgi:transposase
MSGSRRSFTLEYKREAVALVTRQGLSFSEAARRLGIGPNLVRNWKTKLENGQLADEARQPSPLEMEVSRLRAENERLKMEREILKKATAFFAKESR